MPVQYTLVSTPGEVDQILALQAANHKSVVDAATIESQGFVTVKHNPAVLHRMNETTPSVIAKEGDILAGYCLVMPPSFFSEIPELIAFGQMAEKLTWKNRPLSDFRWFVMGQVCVAREFRGLGVFDGMYAHLKEATRSWADVVITEISSKNARSRRAHERVGFEDIFIYEEPAVNETWHVVALEL